MDAIALSNHYRIEFVEDLGLCMPRPKPRPITRSEAPVVRWGRTLGPDRQSSLDIGSN
jgi:hypothetical protein